MTVESLRKFCLSLPHVKEDVKWENHLCFLIAGKMFAMASLDKVSKVRLSMKVSAEKFAELTELPGVIQAPYLARGQWVALEEFSALRDTEIKELISESYRLIKAKLPKKLQQKLS